MFGHKDNMRILKLKHMTWIFIVSIATAVLAILSGYLQYKEKLNSIEKTLKKETELKEVYKTLENKSDIIIKLQNTSQEKTNQIVAIQNKLQEKTELTIELNKKLLENQIKINSDYEKELNPLFPMSISIEIELPFSNYIFSKEYINKIYSLKNEIQNGGDYNKTDITIQWKDNKKEVFQLDYNNASKLPEHNILSLFFNERPFSIRLQRNHGGIFDDFNNKSIIFKGEISHRPIKKNEYAIGKINFDSETITIHCLYKEITLFEPKDNKPIGISDLDSNYLVVSPNQILGDYKISKFTIDGGGNFSQYLLNINFSDSDKYKTDEYIEYIHRLNKEEISTWRIK